MAILVSARGMEIFLTQNIFHIKIPICAYIATNKRIHEYFIYSEKSSALKKIGREGKSEISIPDLNAKLIWRP